MHSSNHSADCEAVRGQLHDLRRGRLDRHDRDAVVAHLAGCAECRQEDDAEALLDRLLHERLPRHAATPELRRKLEAIAATVDTPAAAVGPSGPATGRRRLGAVRWIQVAIPALAASVALVTGGVVWGRHSAVSSNGATARMVDEAVGDHLRVLAATHPIDLESSASHEVKPWFEGRLDFAPNVPHDVGELRLRGGSVGYFLDRKAAVMSYALRRHAVTVLAFPTQGLAWPPVSTANGFPAYSSRVRGIEVILWRHGDLGYAVVADVNGEELWRVAADLYRATAG